MLKIDIRAQEKLTSEQVQELEAMWKRCAARIVLSTTLAGSGHPGGSLSILHTLLVLYSTIRHFPDDPRNRERDRVLMSIGHVSPGVYAVLSEFGYVREEDFLTEFRRAGSIFTGHVEQIVPGVEWNTGNLGQGLSVAAGFAAGEKLRKGSATTYCIMGDGEQQKGQIAEARRFASAFGLDNLVGIVDRNHLQIGGSTEDVMPVRVRDEYEAAGWNVVYVPNGNDFNEVYKGLRRAVMKQDLVAERPVLLVMRTVMGKGISFMENKAKYHGSPLPADDCRKALEEIGVNASLLDEWQEKRAAHDVPGASHSISTEYPSVDQGSPILYDADTVTDCRSAYGNALEDLADKNNRGAVPKIVGFSCDLEGSVKMQGFHKVNPDAFFETGIQEHHAAACAGAMSADGFVPFFSTFGVFAVGETYNQHRLTDQNHGNIKVVATHVGLDVGEDGPTHQCIDYISLMENIIGFSIFIPADPNQTDRIVRHVAATPGSAFVGMGRSKMATITDRDGKPFFGVDYRFEPGRADILREGNQATIIGCGSIMPNVLEAAAMLEEDGFSVAVVNMASIKPVDQQAILEAADRGPVVTVEDHIAATGLGGITARVMALYGKSQRLVTLGVTRYGSSGKPADLYADQGLDAQGIKESVKKLL